MSLEDNGLTPGKTANVRGTSPYTCAESVPRDYAAAHRAMVRWIRAQQAAGWPSPEMERAALRVSCGLYACARNNPIPPVILRGLAEDTVALERSRNQ